MTAATMAQARRDFAHGLIVGADVVANPMTGGWSILFHMKGGGLDSGLLLVDARAGAVRQFKTLDAAFSALEQVGIRVESLRVAPL